MTRDDIIRMAREAGFTDSNRVSQLIVRHSNGSWVDVEERLARFAALVAAAEREACERLCREQSIRSAEASNKAKRQMDRDIYYGGHQTALWLADMIKERARSKS